MTEEQCVETQLKYETLKYWYAIQKEFEDELVRGWQKEHISHSYTKQELKISLMVNVATLLLIAVMVILLIIK